MGNLRYREGTISQVRANEASMGGGKDGNFYTDLEHCKSISGLFKWPENESVCVLEPSIGNGEAVITCTGARDNPNIKIFGVELNPEVAKVTKEKPEIEELLPCDFTNGVRIKNQAFSFVFGNPPYMTSDEGEFKERMEKIFLERISDKYIKKGGVLVWVIPYRIFSDPAYLRLLANRYDFLGVWKFRKKEYDKWKQVVFIGRRRQNRISLVSDIQELAKKYETVDLIEELPLTFEGTELFESIEVESTDPDSITEFAPLKFDADSAYLMLGKRPLSDEYHKLADKCTSQEEFRAADIGKPPIPLKKDSLYLMATSGAGQGIAGVRGEDLHLQRGVAEIVEDIQYVESDGDSDSELMKVTSHTAITMTVIETSGRITTLK